MDARKELYRTMLSASIRAYRRHWEISQERMAERLRISPRAYIDLEHGKFCGSGLTVIIFLSQLPREESGEFLQEFYRQLVELEKASAA